MKQNLNDPQKWYDKKQPTLQIEILKSIALNGFQSKTTLIRVLGKHEITDNKTGKKETKLYGITTIDTIVGKMNDKDDKDKLIQIHRKEQQENKKASHIMYSLTEKGIKILIENQYEELKKPYLSTDELKIFLKRFKEDYINKKPTKEFDDWKSPKLKESNILNLYLKINPPFISELQDEVKKYTPKLEKGLKLIKKLQRKLNDAQKELTISQALYETTEFSKR